MKLFTLILLAFLATACQHLPDGNENDIAEEPAQPAMEWQVADNGMRCFPVDSDAFNHPIDELPLPLAPTDSIWPRVQAGLTLPYVDHHSVQQQLNWYIKHPKYFARVQKRASRYLYYVISRMHAENIPFDLALLPIVESAYEPFAYSHGQASGLWQFIPGTGKRFRLDQNWWIDERRDVVESTDAAIKYLKYLHNFFDGNWLHAIAAYNSGEGTVRRAIRRNKAQGKPTDFWHLDLPKETSAYVPKMIALAQIFREPHKYDIELTPIANQPYFTSIELDSQLDLAQAAKLAGISIDEVYYLNAGLNRWATPPQGHYRFNLPVDKAEQFKQALAALPASERVTWHRHKIKPGDTLSTIAKRYNSDKQLIKEINNLRGNRIVAGKTLMVPTASAGKGRYKFSETQRLSKKQSTRPRSANYKQVYRVQSGDSFWRIAKNHKVDVNALAKWNNKSPKDPLRIGEKLVIWKTQGRKSGLRQGKITKVNYRVRKGDSLAKVASKFKVKIGQIINWNGINPKAYLQPGQPLTLFVDVMETY